MIKQNKCKKDSQKLDGQSTKIGVVLTQPPTASGWQLAASGFVGRTSYDGTRGEVLDNLSETGMTSLSSEFPVLTPLWPSVRSIAQS